MGEGGAEKIVRVTVLKVLGRDPAVVLADEGLGEVCVAVLEVAMDALADAFNERFVYLFDLCACHVSVLPPEASLRGQVVADCRIFVTGAALEPITHVPTLIESTLLLARP